MRALLPLLRSARGRWGWIALSILVSAIATLANIGLMAASGWFVTAMGLAGAAGAAINYFTPAALIRALAILRTGGRYADRLISHEATLRLLAALRVQVFAGLVPLAPLTDEEGRSGDLAGRLSADIDRLEQVFLRLVSPMAVAALVLAVVTARLAGLSGRLALTAAGLLACAGWLLPAAAARLGARDGREAADQAAALRRRLIDDLDGLAPLLTTGAWDRHRDELLRRHGAMLAAESRLGRTAALGQSGTGLLGDLAIVATLAVAAPLLVAGRMDGPELTMAVLAVLASFEALAGLPDAFAGLSSILASARRVFALLERRPAVSDPENPAPPPRSLDIVFDAVTLSYPGRHRPALEAVSLRIAEGSRVAILGESGAGKSSLGQLMVRFADPDEGHVRLGGADLRDLALDQLRSRIVLVPQASYLLSTTVGANLRLARPDAPAARLDAAIEAAGFRPVLDRLPRGLDTPIGVAGARLSGGEARRLAIARALVADPPILILDEPGEGLDRDTEAKMLSALIEERAGRTLILITHREAGLELMDRVVVLREGRVAEDGPRR